MTRGEECFSVFRRSIGLSVTGRIPLRRAAIAAAIVWFIGGLPLIFPALRAM